MYGRKFMGTARITFIIDEKGTIEDIVAKVDTKNHTNQILKEAIPASTKTPAKKTAKKTENKIVKAVAKKAVISSEPCWLWPH
jgi:peroxiredoxin Q/BCP